MDGHLEARAGRWTAAGWKVIEDHGRSWKVIEDLWDGCRGAHDLGRCGSS